MKKAEVDIYKPLKCDLSKTDIFFLEHSDLSYIDYEVFRRYRDMFRLYAQGHPYNTLSDEEFMLRLGFVVKIEGTIRITKAGLLLFGLDYHIREAFPHYYVSYLDKRDPYNQHITLSSFHAYNGQWNGSLFSFLLRCLNEFSNVSSLIHTPLEISSYQEGLKESLILAFAHYDLTLPGGIEISVDKEAIHLEFASSSSKQALSTKGYLNPTIANALGSIGLCVGRGQNIAKLKAIYTHLGLPRFEIQVHNQTFLWEIPLNKNQKTMQNSDENDLFNAYLASLSIGESFSRSDVIKALKKSPAMVSIYIAKATKEGKIELTKGFKKGKYTRLL